MKYTFIIVYSLLLCSVELMVLRRYVHIYWGALVLRSHHIEKYDEFQCKILDSRGLFLKIVFKSKPHSKIKNWFELIDSNRVINNNATSFKYILIILSYSVSLPVSFNLLAFILTVLQFITFTFIHKTRNEVEFGILLPFNYNPAYIFIHRIWY